MCLTDYNVIPMSRFTVVAEGKSLRCLFGARSVTDLRQVGSDLALQRVPLLLHLLEAQLRVLEALLVLAQALH